MIVEMEVPVLITGLLVFGVFFAVNSSLHSFLIVAYAGSKKAAEDIGFYYAANAAGRLAGTFLSGFLYYQGGLLACLAGSALFLVITALLVARLPQVEARAQSAHISDHNAQILAFKNPTFTRIGYLHTSKI